MSSNTVTMLKQSIMLLLGLSLLYGVLRYETGAGQMVHPMQGMYVCQWDTREEFGCCEAARDHW